ncbi:asparaginase [Rhizobium sp. SSA_523]|uniref:asparaginase n=1 Tax=Rhizobium sp. SSA_523 TaxID=2952477 RepID=UPI0020919082|nr:asparaginase [Rhizobium sp. SSA_523]MCO5730979.1 asparaginase [Rhizobium sp. SSA_523]WKC24213.1 asparaginase [Rhizobium sp. SSA_523]
MQNPVTVEVTRGNRVESRHRGAAIIVDGQGRTLFSVGDVEAGVFPRSACKAMQALPLIESGAADRFGLTRQELALACSSHSGEDEHVRTAAGMLAKAGHDHTALECGAHWSSHQDVLIHQARTIDRPCTLHNNCSGKHAGFICTCVQSGFDPKGYVGYDHPLQAEIRSVMEDLTGIALDVDRCGIDGCSIPTYAVPLRALAEGFAKMLTGERISPARAAASRRLMEACMAEPFHVAGTKRACTRLMQLAPGKIFAKTGAEGVFVAALPEQGLAIAVKCEDGATRAAEAMIYAVTATCFDRDSEIRTALMAMANRPMHNWTGLHVGDIRVTQALMR